jgi:hypothetical protein
MEIDSYSNSRKTKDWMQKRYKRIFKDYEINNSTKRTQDRVKWRKSFRRPRLSNNEVVAPEEEEEVRVSFVVDKYPLPLIYHQG